MNADILLLPGGIGLFLLGMIVLTEGLRELAGATLRRMLSEFTRTPARGALAGALATAVVQSSSATTVTAVGFVGAGLLTFPQGLGIVFGANIGTTITGWLVAIIGFKLDLGVVVLPLVFAGVLLRLFAGPTLARIGWALVGFSLLFVGIDAMQQGMAQFEGTVTPQDFPGDTLFGRLQLVLIGVAITLVTQSSSAGVATALVALGAGTISFSQAASMVIGMDVGTTFTAALATIGGSTAMRRTGYAHVIYNVLTGIAAFLLLDLYAYAADAWIPGGTAGNAEIALVGFHTAFNALGVVLVLPVARPFAGLVIGLVPERQPHLLRRLDQRLLADPASAVDAAAATVRDIAERLTGLLVDLLDPHRAGHRDPQALKPVEDAIDATRRFVEQIRSEPAQKQVYGRHLAGMHALDHLSRLAHRCGQSVRIGTLAGEPRLRRLSRLLRDLAAASLRDHGPDTAERRFEKLRAILRRQHHRYRERAVEAAALQRTDAQTTLRRLDSIRWLNRVSYHLWRISHHLRRAEAQQPGEPAGGDRQELDED